jgi:hypothetical protein
VFQSEFNDVDQTSITDSGALRRGENQRMAGSLLQMLDKSSGGRNTMGGGRGISRRKLYQGLIMVRSEGTVLLMFAMQLSFLVGSPTEVPQARMASPPNSRSSLTAPLAKPITLIRS